MSEAIAIQPQFSPMLPPIHGPQGNGGATMRQTVKWTPVNVWVTAKQISEWSGLSTAKIASMILHNARHLVNRKRAHSHDATWLYKRRPM